MSGASGGRPTGVDVVLVLGYLVLNGRRLVLQRYSLQALLSKINKIYDMRHVWDQHWGELLWGELEMGLGPSW